jgi:putative glutamine amidotransferase
MFSKRPIIGITGPNHGGTGAWIFTAAAIWWAGGRPVRITPQEPQPNYELDGLILGGGADIEPVHYGATPSENASVRDKPIPKWHRLLSYLIAPFIWLIRALQHTKTDPHDPRRDKLEFVLLKQIIEEQKPVLGICRGMQLINVYFGGSLHQDISGFYGEGQQVSSILPHKSITIRSGTKLHDFLGQNEVWVNALHHQAVKDYSDQLLVAGHDSKTGIIQALEHFTAPFIIGVQWHPEYMLHFKKQRNLFKALVRQASQ